MTIIFGLLGLCLGSFINALVWRIQEQEKPKNKQAKVNLSIANGRSVCVNCKHQLAWYDLVPVSSWLALAGKCRYCHKPISKQYPAVELMTAVLFAVSFVFWPVGLLSIAAWIKFSLWLGLLVILIALAVYDIKTMLLPDKLVKIASIFVLLDILLKLSNGFNAAILISAVVGLLAFGGVFYILFQISAGKWIGGGDVKLGFVLGAYLANAQMSLLAIFLASLIGLVPLLVLLPYGRASMRMKIPFGPMLIGGTVITVLFGQNLISWYVGLVL
jgi:leader peptidase (prepilin peptidase)/N-methyltransferase